MGLSTAPRADKGQPAVSARVRWWRRSGAIETLIGAVAAIAVAGVSLFIEQALIALSSVFGSHAAEPANWVVLWTSLAVTFGALAFVWFLLRERAKQKRTRGTLYYVRALAPGMSDWHEGRVARKRAEEDHYDVRTIQRIVPMQLADSVHELTGIVDDIARALEATMNEDSVDTAYLVVPNMLWPVAAAVGAHLDVRPNMQLDEVMVDREMKPRGLPVGAQGAQQSRRAPARLVWSPRRDQAFAGAAIGAHVAAPKPNSDGAPGTVLVGMDLSDGPGALSLSALSAAVFVDIQGAEWDAESKLAKPTRYPQLSTDSAVPITQRLDPQRLVHDVARSILETIHKYHGHRVYLAAMVSKTFALALGWLLADPGNLGVAADEGMRGCRDPGCRNPWSVLTPLSFAAGRYTPVRVHPSQPTVDVIARDIAAMQGAPRSRETSVSVNPLDTHQAGQPARIVNLTAHEVVLWDDATQPHPPLTSRLKMLIGWRRPHPRISWAPSGQVARIVEQSLPGDPLITAAGRIPTAETSYRDEIENLPAACPGTAFIVSRVLAASIDRDDLLFPAGEVRNRAGAVVGCRALGRFVDSGDHA